MHAGAGWRAARKVLGSGIGASMKLGASTKVPSRIRGGLLGLLAAVIQSCGVGLLLLAGSLAKGSHSSGSRTGGWGSGGPSPAGSGRGQAGSAGSGSGGSDSGGSDSGRPGSAGSGSAEWDGSDSAEPSPGGAGSAGARPAGRHRRPRHAAPRPRGAPLGGVH
jgi:hypothetical protein